MPFRPKSRGGRGGSGGGRRSIPLLTPASSSGASLPSDIGTLERLNLTNDLAYSTGAATPESKLADRLAQLLGSRDPSQPYVAEEAARIARILGDDVSPERMAELGLPAPNNQKSDDSIKGKVFRGVDEALRFIDRPRQALLEGVQAVGEDLGSLDYFSPGASKLNDPGNLSDEAKKVIGDAAGSGGYRDILTALRGNARWDPTTQKFTKNLDFAAALGQDPGQAGGGPAGWAVKGANFTGNVAVDPLNLVGGGTKAASNTVIKKAAPELAEIAAREGVEALTPTLARQLEREGVSQVSEEAIAGALRKVGVRKGLTDAQRESVLQAMKDSPIRTKRLFSDKERVLDLAEPKRELLLGPKRSRADKTMIEALRFDAGGIRVGDRTIPRSNRIKPWLFGETKELGRVNVAAGASAARDARIERLMESLDLNSSTLERQMNNLADVEDGTDAYKKIRNAVKSTEGRRRKIESQIDELQNAVTAEDIAAVDPTLVPVTAKLREFQPGVLGDSALVRWARKAFVPRSELLRAESLPADVATLVGDAEVIGRAAASGAKRQGAGTVEKAVNAAREMVGKSKAILTPEGERTVLAALEKGGSLDDITDPVLREVADATDNLRKLTYDMLIREGLADPAKLQEASDYMRRYFTPEGIDALIKAGELNIPQLNPYRRELTRIAAAARQSGSLKKRELFKDLTIGQIEDEIAPVLREAGLLGADQQLVLTNPLEIALRRHGEVAEAYQYAKTVDEMADGLRGILGQQLVYRVRPGEKAPRKLLSKDLVKVSIPTDTFGTVYAHPDIADHLTGYFKAMSTEEGINKFLGFLSQWQQMWKAYATVPVVGGTGFHVKNALGNVANNYLRGVKMSAYKDAFDLQRAVISARKAAPDLPIPAALEAAGASADDIARVELALERGVIDEGFFSLDMAGNATTGVVNDVKAVKGRLRAKTRLYSDPANAIGVRSGRKIGEAIEDNARLAHFLSKLDEFGDPDLAARSVKEALFDYGDLTPFEQGIRRYVSAFYTFTRKNTPFILGELARNPAGVNRIANIEKGIFGDEQGNNVPGFAQEMGPVANAGISRLLTGRGNQAVVNVETPAEAAFKTLDPLIRVAGWKASYQDTAQSLMGLTAGGPAEAAKQTAELATGSSIFTGSSLTDPEGNYKMNPLLRLSQTANPSVTKVARLLGASGSTSNDGARLRIIKALTGLTGREITPELQDIAKNEKIRTLEDLIEALKKDGKVVGRISELQQTGRLDRPQG